MNGGDCHCGEVVDKKCNKTMAIVDFALLSVASVGLPSTRRRSEGMHNTLMEN